MSSGHEAKEAEEEDEQHQRQGDETVAGDAFFVTQRAQPLDVASARCLTSLGLAGGGPRKWRLIRRAISIKSNLRAPISLK